MGSGGTVCALRRWGAGRSWTVALRRGTSVIVGRDLWRFSASVLSEELRALLHPRTRQGGDTIAELPNAGCVRDAGATSRRRMAESFRAWGADARVVWMGWTWSGDWFRVGVEWI